jgi:hypothetical protein
MNKIVISASVVFLLFSCGPQERVSKEIFEEVNQAMEVKRLSEVEILNEAMVWGDSISKEAQAQLMASLQNAVAAEGTAGAVEFCNVQALPILEDLGRKYEVEIRRVSNRYRNPADQPQEDEKSLLEAYEYNAENGSKSDPNIQKFDNGEMYLYTKAIVIPGDFCLSCHGKAGKDINDETLERLNKLYPEDKATGHQVGDLRGMWSIRIPKKVVVNRL